MLERSISAAKIPLWCNVNLTGSSRLSPSITAKFHIQYYVFKQLCRKSVYCNTTNMWNCPLVHRHQTQRGNPNVNLHFLYCPWSCRTLLDCGGRCGCDPGQHTKKTENDAGRNQTEIGLRKALETGLNCSSKSFSEAARWKGNFKLKWTQSSHRI